MADIPIVDLEAESHEPISFGDETQDYTVVDTDAHFVAPAKDVLEYMDEPWRTRALQVTGDEWTEEAGERARTNEGKLGDLKRQIYGGVSTWWPGATGDRQQHGKIIREHSAYPDAPQIVRKVPESMDFLGVDISIQISHLLLHAPGIQADDKREADFFKAYTKYALDNVFDPEEGIYGFVPLPQSDVARSLEMLEMVEDEDAIVGAVILTAGAVPPLGNRKYEPIYERAEKMGLPMAFHTSGSSLDSLPGYGSFVETHTLGFLQSNQSQLVSLIFQGIPERYPDLDLILVESGVTYLPALGARMDEEWLKRTEEAPTLEKRPSRYLSEDFYYTTQPLEKTTDIEFLEKCFDMVGDRLMYASDYPHWDFDRPTGIVNLPFLSEEEKEQILSGNAMEVFDL